MPLGSMLSTMKTLLLLLSLLILGSTSSSSSSESPESPDSEAQNLRNPGKAPRIGTLLELILTGKIQNPTILNSQDSEYRPNSPDSPDSEGYCITDPILLQDIDDFNQLNPTDHRDFWGVSGLLRLIRKGTSRIGMTLRRIFQKVGRVVAVGKRILKSISQRSMRMIRSIGTRFRGDGHVPQMLDRVGDVVDVVERVGDKVISRSMQYGETDEGMGLMYSVQEGEDGAVEQGFLPADKNPLEVIFAKEQES